MDVIGLALHDKPKDVVWITTILQIFPHSIS